MESDEPEGWEATYEAGDPAFVDQMRQVHDPEVLKSLAARWAADARLGARSLLRAYFDRPLNAYGHEVLVKRLFKAAEAAGDDEALAWMMTALDRSIDRRVQLSRRTESAIVATREEARDLARLWARGGERVTRTWQVGPDQHVVVARGLEPGLVVPHGTRMPGNTIRLAWVLDPAQRRYVRVGVPEWVIRAGLVERMAGKGVSPDPADHGDRLARFRLFSVATRHYLRRRLWRYFEHLGETDGARYLRAMTQALVLYREEDADEPLRLFDRFCLVHVLFGNHPELRARSNGWELISGQPGSDQELGPQPAFLLHWEAAPEALMTLIRQARNRVVRYWAMQLANRQLERIRPLLDLSTVEALLTHRDPEVAQWGVGWLPGLPESETMDLAHWRRLITAANAAVEPQLSVLIERQIAGTTLHPVEAVELALMRPEHLALRGLEPLRGLAFDPDQWQHILPTAQAPCAKVRFVAIGWLQQHVSGGKTVAREWVSDWLQSPFADTRSLGLACLQADVRLRSDLDLWEALDRPHADLCFGLVGVFGQGGVGPEGTKVDLVHALRLSTLLPAWAGVLNGPRQVTQRLAEQVLGQMRRRLERMPGEADAVLPLLAGAARSESVRVARAAVAALARVRALRPDLNAAVDAAVPELHWLS